MLYLNDKFLGSGYSDNETISNNIFNNPNLEYFGILVGSEYKIVQNLYFGINAGIGFSKLKSNGEYFVFDNIQDIRLSTITFKEEYNSKIMFNTNANLGYKFNIVSNVILDVFIQGNKWFGGKRKRESIQGNNLEQIPANIQGPYLTRFEDFNINPEFIMGGISLGYKFQ